MATKLLKPIKRELMATIQAGKHRGRPINAELQPGDILKFKVKGTRQEYTVSLHAAFTLAQLVTFDRIYNERLQDYNKRKKAGDRVRKPKKPQLFLHRVFFETLKRG
jgi:hypothetical protein